MSRPDDFYTLGLDLGQAADYTALAIDHVTYLADPSRPGKRVRHHAIRHLERWQLGTSYVDMARDVHDLLERLPDAKLAADKTGVGAAVLDVFRSAGLSSQLAPILITGGHETTRHGLEWHVPKKELVSALQSAMQQRRLQIAPVPLAPAFRREAEHFRVKVSVTTGNESFEAWRERDHDDLVLAVALAVWYSERGQSRFTFFC